MPENEQIDPNEIDFVDNLSDADKLEMLQEAILSCEDTIQKLSDEKDNYLAQLQRAAADFANYKRRAKKDEELAVSRAIRGFLEALIPVMDNIDYAVTALPDQSDALAKPLMMIRDAFSGVLSQHKVQRVDPLPGDPFDPEIHQAISVQIANVEKEVIGHVARAGYTIGDQVFRPSDVVVFQPEKKDEQVSESD